MRHYYREQPHNRNLARDTVLLCAAGLVLNMVPSTLAGRIGLPLYLDNIGSVLTAVLAGPVMGMAVGYLSNLLTTLSRPMYMYYGILTILIALTASWLSRTGRLMEKRGWLLAYVWFVLIGGVGGSLMSWVFYGGLNGYAAPIAQWLLAHGMAGDFWAQLLGDLMLDLLDKAVTVLVLYEILSHYPSFLSGCFPYSYLYERSEESRRMVEQENRSRFRSRSIESRLVQMLVIFLILISVLSTAIGVGYYALGKFQSLENAAAGMSRLAALQVDGDQVETYLREGWAADGYQETSHSLQLIFTYSQDLKYLYVYQIQADGAHVVFDFDTKEVPAEQPGSIIEIDPDYVPYLKQLLAGETVPEVHSSSKYGRLITAYAPIRDSSGRTVAYAGADASMDDMLSSTMLYLIKMISMQMGISLLIISRVILMVRRRILRPMNALVDQAVKFEHADPEHWLESDDWKNRARINTGDEIETLYRAECDSQKKVCRNVKAIMEADRQRKRAAELAEKNRELKNEVQRADDASAAKAEFYSRMSHDMRTPMNGILGLVQLSEGENDPKVLKEYLGKIGDSGSYLLSLINDSLDMSKLEQRKMELHPSPVNAEQLVENMKEMLMPSIEEKGLHLDMDCSRVPMNIYIEADELRLKQIFMNLLSNAIKFTPSGGTISFRLEDHGYDSTHARPRCIIGDTGIGMSRDFLANGIFKPYSQETSAATAYAGTGLGLSIVYRLVELMHGRISVESQLGRGSVFTVDLEFAIVEPETAETAAADSANHAQLAGRRVLIAEDNELNAEIAIKLLEQVGMHAERAENGAEAVQMVRKAAPHYYDAILMDIRMPIMDGLQAAREIRAMARADTREIPIIAMTANAYPEDRQQAQLAGIDGYAAKPIDIQQLLDLLQKKIKAHQEA